MDSRENTASVRDFVDAAIRKGGDFGVYGDMREGLDALEKEFVVTIRESGDYYEVDLGPRSGEGHDFNFRVSKETGAISDLAVGEIEPEPDDLEE